MKDTQNPSGPWAQAERLWASLLGLGPRKLAALAIVGVSVVALTIFSGYWLSRPTMEPLYTGLDRDDVVHIGSVLRESGISFDVNSEGNAIYVSTGQGALARMTLAERGLPHSGTVGNELFDKLGSLGLTSFMQEVTRVRAIEGELGRTIQMMRGIKAARVHIVMADQGSFRREKQAPTASVVIRTDGHDDREAAFAIRNLVAAAIPQLKPSGVTVVNVDGRLLDSQSDKADKSPESELSLERAVTAQIRETINQTLAPYLNMKNFQVSVAAKLNADQRQTNETIYDPESRAERSVRVTKEHQTSQNAAGQRDVGVQANLPKTATGGGETKQSNDDTDKREQLTNYEVSSKSTTVTSAGYKIEALSVAVLVNRSTLAASLGDKASPEAISKQVQDLEQLVRSAAGLRADRGDSVKISVVDFVEAGRDLEPVPGPSFGELVLRQSGAMINAGAILAVCIILIWFGVRPATRALLSAPGQAPRLAATEHDGLLAIAAGEGKERSALSVERKSEDDAFFAALLERREKAPQRHLQKLIEFDEGQAAAIVRNWIKEGAAA